MRRASSFEESGRKSLVQREAVHEASLRAEAAFDDERIRDAGGRNAGLMRSMAAIDTTTTAAPGYSCKCYHGDGAIVDRMYYC